MATMGIRTSASDCASTSSLGRQHQRPSGLAPSMWIWPCLHPRSRRRRCLLALAASPSVSFFHAPSPSTPSPVPSDKLRSTAQHSTAQQWGSMKQRVDGWERKMRRVRTGWGLTVVQPANQISPTFQPIAIDGEDGRKEPRKTTTVTWRSTNRLAMD